MSYSRPLVTIRSSRAIGFRPLYANFVVHVLEVRGLFDVIQPQDKLCCSAVHLESSSSLTKWG